MTGSKTSAEKAREDAKKAAADDMFGGAFGGLDEMAPTSTDQTTEQALGITLSLKDVAPKRCFTQSF